MVVSREWVLVIGSVSGHLIKVTRDQQCVLLVTNNASRVLRKGKIDVSALPRSPYRLICPN